jgi:hypothetical protein
MQGGSRKVKGKVKERADGSDERRDEGRVEERYEGSS